MVCDSTFGAADSERAVQSGEWLLTNYKAARGSSGNRTGLFSEFSKRELRELSISEETERLLAVQCGLIQEALALLEEHDAQHSEKQKEEDISARA
jgi:hypothetical protein